jgi:hypothetical protein
MVPGSDIARSRQHERLDRLGRCCHVGRDAKGWIGLGDAATSAGTLREADAAFLKYIELARRTNDESAISVGLDRHGDVLVDQGNLPEALKAYRDGLAIRDRLAKADPCNAGWQRGLSPPVLQQDRRRAGDSGQSAGGAEIVPRRARHQRPSGAGRPRQRRLAARPYCLVRQIGGYRSNRGTDLFGARAVATLVLGLRCSWCPELAPNA